MRTIVDEVRNNRDYGYNYETKKSRKTMVTDDEVTRFNNYYEDVDYVKSRITRFGYVGGVAL